MVGRVGFTDVRKSNIPSTAMDAVERDAASDDTGGETKIHSLVRDDVVAVAAMRVAMAAQTRPSDDLEARRSQFDA